MSPMIVYHLAWECFPADFLFTVPALNAVWISLTALPLNSLERSDSALSMSMSTVSIEHQLDFLITCNHVLTNKLWLQYLHMEHKSPSNQERPLVGDTW